MLNKDVKLAKIVREANKLIEGADLEGENMKAEQERLVKNLQVGYVELPVCRKLLLGSCL